ncbi:MAG: adenylosuccinate synthase [Alphaproteobacteria bacterium]|nr:adenylosuccinate synthase [Alphaproteobacteria bacterium]
MIDILIGLQWGDEGKGKLVDFLAHKYDVIARYQGGPNAGHTIYLNGKKLVLHQVPSGVLHANKINVIGGCVVLDPIVFHKEIIALQEVQTAIFDKIILAENTSLIVPTHQMLDQMNEDAKGSLKIGSTLKGIGPAYMDKAGRNALRVRQIFQKNFYQEYQDLKKHHLNLMPKNEAYQVVLEEKEALFFKAIEFLKNFKVVNMPYFIHDCLKKGLKILGEGAQGTMLDIDLGTYPFVTSSNTVSSGICASLGVAPQLIREVIGVSKGYCTRVGNGPFPTEIIDQEQEAFMRKMGNEFGATTGRPRRCGWLDLVALNYACMINGVTQLMLTKMDVLDHFDQLQVCHQYRLHHQENFQFTNNQDELKDIQPIYTNFKGWKTNISQIKHAHLLPEALHTYLKFIKTQIGVNITAISNGVEQQDIIQMPNYED